MLRQFRRSVAEFREEEKAKAAKSPRKNGEARQ